MKKLLVIFLCASAFVSAQNRYEIEKIFKSQNIDGLKFLAIKNGIKEGETVKIHTYFKSDEEGDTFEVILDGNRQYFKPEIQAIVNKIPRLDPEEYLQKGEIMRYQVQVSFNLPKAVESGDSDENSVKPKSTFDKFRIVEYFPVKWVKIDPIDKKADKNLILVDHGPVTEKCKTLTEEPEIKRCLQREFGRNVSRKFDTGLANELNLPPGKQRIYMMFAISKEGEIVNIKCKAPHKKLEEEGIRVINLIPNLYKPGMLNGKPVSVRYTLPLTLMVD